MNAGGVPNTCKSSGNMFLTLVLTFIVGAEVRNDDERRTAE